MSYDIFLLCPACGDNHMHENDGPTYDLAPIFDLALRDASSLYQVEPKPYSIRVLDGRTGADTLPQLRRALDRLMDPTRQQEFLALEPPNKWGDLPGARRVFASMLEAAEKWPAFVWRIT